MPNIQSSGAVTLPDMYQVKADSVNEVSHTGDTNETQLKAYTIPAGLLGINGAVKFHISGNSTGNLGAKYLRLKFGGTQIVFINISASVSTKHWKAYGFIHNKGVENSQSSSLICWDNETCMQCKANVNSTINTALDAVLEVTGQLINAGDSIKIRDFTIEISPTT